MTVSNNLGEFIFDVVLPSFNFLRSGTTGLVAQAFGRGVCDFPESPDDRDSIRYLPYGARPSDCLFRRMVNESGT